MVDADREALIAKLGLDTNLLVILGRECQMMLRRLAPHQNGNADIVPGPDDNPSYIGRIPEGTITRTVNALAGALALVTSITGEKPVLPKPPNPG